MLLPRLLPLLLALVMALPAAAQEPDCLIGEVSFATAGGERVLTLQIHERRAEVPKGLFRLTELPTHGGVFAIYPEPRPSRTLRNSDVLAADIVTFDSGGKVLGLMVDRTGTDLDEMTSGDGMLYAAYLAAGTVEAMGFDTTTAMTGWRCIEAK